MNCTEVTERLPWLANRTLSDEERAEAESHLATCASCRAEFQDIVDFLEHGFAHPSPEAIVQFVYGSLGDSDRIAFQRHIDECAACREEVEMTRQSKAAMPAPPRHNLRWLALAAAVLLAVAGPITYLYRQALQREAILLARASNLEQQLGRLRQPTASARVVDLLPEAFRQRSEIIPPITTIPSASPETLFLLNSQIPMSERGCEVLLEREATTLWQSAAGERGSNGEFLVRIPAGFLKPGDHSLHVVCGHSRETYRVNVN
ncbi:MAG: zf-HC2 domain-containing protein [Acidobacteria bacterium]|nr:zf-HC2 domain-containing protein [Acidobacteriota bacterium]